MMERIERRLRRQILQQTNIQAWDTDEIWRGEKDDEKRALISSLQTEKETATNSRNVKAGDFARDFEIIIRCFASIHSRFMEIKREAAEGKTFDWEF